MFRPTPQKTPAPSAHPRRAFTLIELLAVIAIIGVLAAIIIGSVSKVRDAARRTTCTSNLRQLGTAFNLYAADNRGLYPAPRQPDTTTPANKSANPNPQGDNWQAELGRYVFRDQSVGQIKQTGASVNIAHCPSYDLLFTGIPQLAATNYKTAGYGMNFNINVGGSSLNASTVTRTTRFPATSIFYPAKTVLVGDSSDYHIGVDTSGWTTFANTDPSSPNGKPDGYNSGAPTRHGAVANYLFADGHVATFNPTDAIAVLLYKP
jgi:prepilin-type N-terminal cleavage/methylation domain-containing protein/prepilin-type processing-associated H-X9-DG protein